MTVLSGVRVVTGDRLIEHGFVRLEGDVIAEVGEARPDTAHSGQTVVPGFVDIHVHGGGGATFTTGDPDAARATAAYHLRHGTTTMLASLVSSPFELMAGAVKAFTPLVAEGVLAGIHFEGPYLSAVRCGAQNPAHLRPPAVDELTTLIDAAAGTLRMVTLAPELPGALDAIRLLVANGIVAAIGHTDASYEETKAGIAAGATVGTHLFSGMPSPHHRRPGPVLALLGAPEVTCELIADGIHLHDGTLTFAAGVAGPDRTALITDAMAASGMPDGRYDLGGQSVDVQGGAARLTRDGALAGSTLTMAGALRHAITAGVSLVDAARMASTTPARIIGLDRTIAVGQPADLVVLDEDFRVHEVWRHGELVAGGNQ
jgi:N-acetylglucosamine-6-phosphate deacetylase